VHAVRQAATAKLQQEYADDPQPMSLPSQYPWSFVSVQLTNAKGYEIFYPVMLNKQLEQANQALRTHRLYALMA
jgi:hypothetical protein